MNVRLRNPTSRCPRGAVIFGKRSSLLQEAKRRLQESPGRYVPKVYGETDGGGSFSVTVRVQDDFNDGASADQTFTIHVAETNSAPVLAAIGDQSVAEGATLSLTASATDATTAAAFSHAIGFPPAISARLRPRTSSIE